MQERLRKEDLRIDRQAYSRLTTDIGVNPKHYPAKCAAYSAADACELSINDTGTWSG